MGRLPSDDFKIDETNALLQRVPGLGFSTKSLVKTVGGDGGKINPNTLQVEDTNSAVANILGKGFVAEKLTENRKPVKSRKSLREDVNIDGIEVLKRALDDIKSAGSELVKQNPDQKLELDDIVADIALFIKSFGG